MNLSLKNKSLLALLITSVLFAGAFLFSYYIQPVHGSTPSEASDYQATSTAASTVYGVNLTTSGTIKSGFGSFGSVIITGANTGIVNFYNATTSDVNKRTGQVATSTILLASFPASTAAGTYVFDTQFTYGLYIDLISGAMPTTTVTFR